MRISLGPVFAYEWLIGARKWQGYALRVLFLAILLAGLVLVWQNQSLYGSIASLKDLARVGPPFYNAIVGTELALVLLVAPAATAGALCLDKARGTLLHLLVTDLTDSEIVLGKLAARLVPVLGLVACTLPLMLIATLLGGIDPDAPVGATVVAISLAMLGCALALLLSVWGTKTHEVLLATYVAFTTALLIQPAWTMYRAMGNVAVGPPDWLAKANPFLLCLSLSSRPGGASLLDYAAFAAVATGIAAGLSGCAVAKMRAVAIRHGARPVGGKARRIWLLSRIPHHLRTIRLPGPALDFNPVLWREWHRNRPSRWARATWIVYGVLMTGALGAVVSGVMSSGGGGGPGFNPVAPMAAFTNGFGVAVGLLLLSVAAATSLAEERVRGSLDVLLATPLPTSTILWGKWWGAYRVVLPLTVLPTLVTIALAADSGHMAGVVLTFLMIAAYGAAVTSVGLFTALWIPRLGRAVGVTVAAYVAVTVGWLMLMVSMGHSTFLEGAGMASPFFGPGNLAFRMTHGNGTDGMWWPCALWGVGWITVATAIAAGLFTMTLATFNRRLGRVDDDVRARDHWFSWKWQRQPHPRFVFDHRAQAQPADKIV